MTHLMRVAALLLALLTNMSAFAAARATLAPDRITMGGTATLTIETDEVNAAPDYAPLDTHFVLRGQSSSVQTTIINGAYSAKTTYSVELEPRVEGILTVPAIQVGNSATESLSMTVLPAVPGSAASGDPIYIESELSTQTPYVQQAVTYTVRLYYAMQVNGEVSARAPDNASLQQLGEDRQSQVDIAGRRYGLFERRYLLIAEQSGPLTLPPASFRGTAQSANANGFFTRAQNVSAVGKAFELDVRAQPNNAPQPWLAARSVAVVRGDLPQTTRAGEPLLVELTLSVDGASAAQLPDLELPPIAGAQVFPEPAQRTDSLAGDQPVALMKRRFAIVPAQAGTLQLPALRIGYWNTQSDRADVAQLSALSLTVSPAAATPTIAAPVASVAPAYAQLGGVLANETEFSARLLLWQALTLFLACALLLSLVWGWRRGLGTPPPRSSASPPVTKVDPALLRRALEKGDLSDIADALRHCTRPGSLNLGALRRQLVSGDQIAALNALEQALWAGAGGDRNELRTRLRSAFKSGPQFEIDNAPRTSALPPLYPAR